MTKLTSRTLASLVHFEACGRLLSFSDAAKELSVTTGAVSQQIRKLEDKLGMKLFERQPRGILLTPEGKELLLVTQQSVEAIEAVVEMLQKRSAEDVVRLKSTPSFVFKWLIPHLRTFNRKFPDIRVETYADAALLDLTGGDFDLAIDYSNGEYQDFEAQLLMHETLLPVTSPNYMPDADWNDPAVWQKISLLHDSMPWPDSPRDAEWRYWLDQCGLNNVSSTRGHYFNRADMAIAAADAGLGIALARGSLVSEELESGRLIAPFPPVASCCDYYLLIPKGTAEGSSARVLRDWLQTLA